MISLQVSVLKNVLIRKQHPGNEIELPDFLICLIE